MDKRTRYGLITALLLILLSAAGLFFSLKKPGDIRGYRQVFPVMGTVASFTLYTGDEAAFLTACSRGQAEFAAVNAIADLHDPASELSRLNAAAFDAPFICSPELWLLIMRSRRAYEESDGKFDITVKPLMDLWGFYRKRSGTPPSPAEISAVRQAVGFDKLILDENKHSVRFSRPGMALDLGGIAKGYAVDRAAAAIRTAGIRSGVIDLGGNLKLLPQPPPGTRYYTVGITDPRDKRKLLPEKLRLPGDCAVATSGDYERFVILDGKRFGHIIDPRTGYPEARPAVTVVTGEALDADIFSTSAYLGGENAAQKLQKLSPGSRFYFLPPSN